VYQDDYSQYKHLYQDDYKTEYQQQFDER